jgi:hypothetical protein
VFGACAEQHCAIAIRVAYSITTDDIPPGDLILANSCVEVPQDKEFNRCSMWRLVYPDRCRNALSPSQSLSWLEHKHSQW